MSHPIKVGIFLVGGILLFSIGLFLIGSESQLFGHHFTVYAQFNNIDTLTTGAKVRVSGMDAGEITNIQVPQGPSKEFRLQLNVDEKFRPIVRKDSLASIETEGMVGNKFVNIKKGRENSPECPPGCTLPTQEPVSIGELMRQGSDMVSNMQSTVQHVNGLIEGVSPKIEQMASNSVNLTGNANAIVANIRHGRGAAGQLLSDDGVASNVDTTIANAKQTSASLKQASGKVNVMISDVQRTDLPDVHRTLNNTRDLTHQVDQAVGTFLAPGNNKQNTAVALRNTIHSAQQTTSNLADDTEAIKTNFFFRGFFNRRGFYNLQTITPSKYAASEFVKKPRARVWVPSAGLFKTRPNGTPELTDTGRAILDQSMSDLVRYLPNNPIVVEGYATSGLPDEQYLLSRQRAVEVSQYLESKFHLSSKRVGVMAFGDHPPKATGKETWDGVCLVLVVEKKR
ncbi:MAG TPA: MlaD family protein [Terriglobales bacterium]|nr:MlaD family protein [Terriglobales bacterium]